MDFESFKDLLSRQRAVRSFDTSRTVDDATVEEIIRVATFAPNGGNRQPWSFLVISDPDIKAKLRAIYDEQATAYLGGPPQGQTPWSEVPVLIAVCTEAPDARSGPLMGASVFPAVQNLLLAVHAKGLGSVLTTLWKPREQEVKSILGIPANVEIHAILPIGWPDRAYGRNKRRPVAEVAYREQYGNSW